MISGWITPEQLDMMHGSCNLKREMTDDELYDLEPDLTPPQSRFILLLMRKVGIKKLSELNMQGLRNKSNGRLGKWMAQKVIEKLKVEEIKQKRKANGLE